MRDWKAMNIATGAAIPSEEIERLTKPLAGLEETFRPLAESLCFTDEPAVMFDAAEEAE